MSTPFETFVAESRVSAGDEDQRAFVQQSLSTYSQVRATTESQFDSYEQARSAAAEIKWQAIERLDEYLVEFADNLEARGVHVHWCNDSDEARAVILQILHDCKAKRVVKSKCMTTEEIHLNEFLAENEIEVVESDLGEYIVQLRKEPPYHFVFPAMHLKRGAISELFEKELGTEPTSDPEVLTDIARRAIREKYLSADVGISGANFGIAETGMISITENEGNARLTTSLPPVHVAVMGIEKILPKFTDLATLLPLLATAATGQQLTAYNSLFSGPRGEGELDGPQAMHVVLLDNHRTRLLADPELRDALRCIRCGACLNVCPVYKNIGGHAYGTTYQGPIGAVITPHLRGLQQWKHLSNASSLCGACTETCPVKIDLHNHLLRNRQQASESRHGGFKESLLMGLYAAIARRPRVYAFFSKAGRLAYKLTAPLHGTRLDPFRSWKVNRDWPVMPQKTFHEAWKEREG